MKKSLAGRVGLLGKGQKVRVKGKFYTGALGDVNLEDSEYEELTPSSVPRLTAETLAKEFTADENMAAKKYGNKEVIVQGTIMDLVEKDGLFSVKLPGNGKVRVSCTMLAEDEFKTAQEGRKGPDQRRSIPLQARRGYYRTRRFW